MCRVDGFGFADLAMSEAEMVAVLRDALKEIRKATFDLPGRPSRADD